MYIKLHNKPDDTCKDCDELEALHQQLEDILKCFEMEDRKGWLQILIEDMEERLENDIEEQELKDNHLN